jgi:hypothetical protein
MTKLTQLQINNNQAEIVRLLAALASPGADKVKIRRRIRQHEQFIVKLQRQQKEVA